MSSQSGNGNRDGPWGAGDSQPPRPRATVSQGAAVVRAIRAGERADVDAKELLAMLDLQIIALDLTDESVCPDYA